MSDAPKPALRLEGVSKSYETSHGPLRVFENLGLEVFPGELISVTGASGSGKSTLLHIAGGLDRPTAGTVSIAGHRVDHLDEKRLALIRNRHLGYVFQSHHLLPEFTALENVLIAWRIGNRDEAAGRARSAELLDVVGLGGRIAHRTGELSGGEMQRVALARALVNSPDLVLADEPTGNLDSGNSEKMVDLLTRLCIEMKTAVVFVTHSEELARKCHRRFRLESGSLRAIA